MSRNLAAALVLLALLPAGCGSASASPESVVRDWSEALNDDDNERAADLFATDARVVQGDLMRRLHTHADAVAFNSGLPCSGRIVELDVRGNEVEAVFVLGDRRFSRCDGPGQRAAAIFHVRDGKIVLWHQVGAPVEGGSEA
jgi:limonene-1,2-epoxide hydrolase